MKHLLILFLLCFSKIIIAQSAEKKYSINGYISTLQQNFMLLNPLTGKRVMLTDNLLHNRINIKYYLNERWTFRADIRSRLLWGELTKLNLSNPKFAQKLNNFSNDAFPFSAYTNNQSSILHTVLDRFFVEYSTEKWEARLGRQRINWGITTVWNPNDIFNTASFFDFDYIEQPGSDALRISRYIGASNKVEFAISPQKDFDKWTAALLWKTNLKTYDVQLLTGWMEEEFVFGTGWAGNLKNIGFKGEISAFINNNPLIVNSLSATTSLDYFFKKSWYTSFGILYNSNGKTQEPFQELFQFAVTPKNLYPYKWACLGQLTIPFNPLLSGNLAIIYSPVKANPLFINPNISYNIKDNWTLSMISQLVFSNDAQEQYQNLLNGFFLRLKYNY